MKNLIYILLLSSISTPQLLAQDIIDKFNRIKFEEAIKNPKKFKEIKITKYHSFFQLKGEHSHFYFDTLGRMEKCYIYGRNSYELTKNDFIITDSLSIRTTTNSLVKDNNIIHTSQHSMYLKYKSGRLFEIKYCHKGFECTKNNNFCYSDSSISYEEHFYDFIYQHTYAYMRDDFCDCYAVVKKESVVKLPKNIDTTENRIYKNNSADRDIYIFNSNNILTDFISISKDGFIGIPYTEKNGVGVSHIKFTNFDKNGNWTRSFFILGNKRKFRSKRKITYYE